MARRSVGDHALLVSLLALAVAWINPACTAGDGAETPCSTAAECDDHNPCTSDVCTGDHCVQTPVPDGPGALAQTEVDCARNECHGGVQVSVDDPTDVASDSDDCTHDSCINGVSSHLPEADGIACSSESGSGICTGGTCQPPLCSPLSSCEDGNACTANACNTAGTMCESVPIDGIPTPGKPQTPGDCQLSRCVKGKDTQVPDDADVSDDGNPCTTDLCDQGERVHQFLPAGSPCGDGLVCDGGGNCGG